MVNRDSKRLFFVDAMRAWAILMMLQGHFIDGLLDPIFRDPTNLFYTAWLYFRGITAPVFFTISGFIFTYLLVKGKDKGWQNPRVKKGVKRGLQLLLIGYLLRLNLIGLFIGEVYSAFFLVDVLHCIGLSLLTIIGIYVLLANRNKNLFPVALLAITLVLFLLEPIYKQWSFSVLPDVLANYFTRTNGSVFTIIPWLGYTSFGGFIAILFSRFKNHSYFYKAAISLSLILGTSLIFISSKAFLLFFEQTGIQLFQMIEQNNYLFIRLGDVFLVFSIFMIFRNFLANKTILKIGGSTLSIYVIHFVILYGSFTGLGLYDFFHHRLTPFMAISGAVLFMVGTTVLALRYAKHEEDIKNQISSAVKYLKLETSSFQKNAAPKIKFLSVRLRIYLMRFLRLVRN